MTEFLVVLFPHQRKVLINGESMGETNVLLPLPEGDYTVTLEPPPPDFTPTEQKIKLYNTAELAPLEIEFEEA